MENYHEIQHETTLFAEPIIKIGKFVISNAYINSLVTTIILVVFFIMAGKKIKKIPKGIQNFFEIVLEEALKFIDSITGDRKKTERFTPLVLSLFLFILVNNYLGLIPGVGSLGVIKMHEGHKMFVPIFRGATADLNTTLALALMTVIITHILGVITVGWWNYLNRFINFKTLLEIPKKFYQDKTVIFVHPIKVFVGLIEIIGEIAKVASLAFRLFGNIFAGEVLLVSMGALFAYILPIPFIFMEVLVGLIQALVFAILVLVFMTIATAKEGH